MILTLFYFIKDSYYVQKKRRAHLCLMDLEPSLAALMFA